MTRLAMILIAFAQVALVLVALLRFPAHLAHPDWPPHAKAHLIAQIGATVGLAIVSLAILAGPFRSGQLWAWCCQVLFGLAVFGGYWAGAVMAEPGTPWRGGHTTFALLTACFFTGLGLSWRRFFVGRK